MPNNFLEFLRQQNIFGAPSIGNDMPSQGGITGRMPRPMPIPMGADMGAGVSNTPMDVGAMPPPQFGMPGIQAPDMARQNPYDVSMGDTSFPPPKQFTPGVMPTPGEGMPTPEYGIGSEMSRFKPSNDATQRFEALVNAYPQDKNPSWLRRIAAMITDYTHGPEAGQKVYNEPNDSAKADWKAQVGPAQAAATNERYENVNNRTLAYNQANLDLNERKRVDKEKYDDSRIKVSQDRAEIYRFKAENPNFKFVMPKGGNVMAMDPATGQSHDTGIPTGSLSDLDRLNLTQENTLNAIGARDQNAQDLEGIRQEGRETLAGIRGNEARLTKSTVPGSALGKGEQSTQKKVREYLNAREILNTDPELSKFIKLTGTNEFEVAQPSTSFWGNPNGPTVEQYKKLQQLIFGTGPSVSPTQTKAPNSTTGSIRVQNKEGKTGTFKGTPEEAVAAGYTVIR